METLYDSVSLQLIFAREADTEDLYLAAFKAAEHAYGARSAAAGLCLIELADFLERERRFDEAEQVTTRYREILLLLARQNELIN